MIAIPIESPEGAPMSSKLFGNAKYFALYDPATDRHTLVSNEGCGNGIKTAAFLLERGATSALYGFLGDGPFHTMIRGGMKVFWLGRKTMRLQEAIRCALKGQLVEVTPDNSSLYLDPGTDAGVCTCGCSHD